MIVNNAKAFDSIGPYSKIDFFPARTLQAGEIIPLVNDSLHQLSGLPGGNFDVHSRSIDSFVANASAPLQTISVPLHSINNDEYSFSIIQHAEVPDASTASFLRSETGKSFDSPGLTLYAKSSWKL